VRRLLPPLARTGLANVRAVIAPHAGYGCSGMIAGTALRALAGVNQKEPVVYMLGPAHYKPISGIGLSSAHAFATPLGNVPVATERMAELRALGAHYAIDDVAHKDEHCLEVQLPFLQIVLGDGFRVVPLLFGESSAPERVATDLSRLLRARPDDLLVVSSDLSHYHPYQEAVIIDNALLKHIALGDTAAVNAGEACGALPILCLMSIARRLGWTPHLLAYANSGDTCGSQREVVGYGAVAYTG
jgi:MEMO1 family protein